MTFQKAYEIATSMEITSRNMAVLQESMDSETATTSRYKQKGLTDDSCGTKLLVLGAEEIIVHKRAGVRN